MHTDSELINVNLLKMNRFPSQPLGGGKSLVPNLSSFTLRISEGTPCAPARLRCALTLAYFQQSIKTK